MYKEDDGDVSAWSRHDNPMPSQIFFLCEFFRASGWLQAKTSPSSSLYSTRKKKEKYNKAYTPKLGFTSFDLIKINCKKLRPKEPYN